MGPQIISFIKLFPLLLPIWEQRPITTEDIIPGPYPVIATSEEIALQEQALRYTDRDLRCRIARHLRETGREDGFQVLIRLLQAESDPKVLTTVMEQIRMSAFTDPSVCALLAPHLISPDEDIRYWAMTLYGEQKEADLKILMKAAASDSSETVREAAMDHLYTYADRIKLPFFQTLWQDENPKIRAQAFAAALRKEDILQHRADLADAVRKGHVLTRCALAKELPSTAQGITPYLVPLLKNDPHATVRAILAESLEQIADRRYLPVLISMLQDPDPEVRRVSAKSMAIFPEPESVDALTQALADSRTLVRREAESSLVTLNVSLPVSDTVATQLSHTQAHARYHALRLLGRLKARKYEERITRMLPHETEPMNIGAAIFALGHLEAVTTAQLIASRATHPSPIVRSEVATALGRLNVADTYGTLKTLAFDKEEEVRQAAIISIGWIGDGNVFSSTILKVLETVKGTKMMPLNRNAAMWSAGRLRPVDPKLTNRLVIQATTPVVPGEMGEMLFEEDRILISAAFAAATRARDDSSAVPAAEKILTVHSTAVDLTAAPETTSGLAPSAEVIEYARQARAILKGEPIEPAERPTHGFSFDYGKLAD